MLSKIFLTSAVIVIISFMISCTGEKSKPASETKAQTAQEVNAVTPTEKIDLWNGKDFTGWKKFIPDKNVNPDEVWTAENGILKCAGKPSGYIRTTGEYSNYKLTVIWRWPAKAGNSGVLLHMTGEDKVWPKSIEAQLESGNAGDFWLIGGNEIAEHTDKSSRRIVKKADSSEKPLGEWNTYKIICKDNTITLYVNDVLQNKGTDTSVNAGKICFQSEGVPIDFKQIYLEPLD